MSTDLQQSESTKAKALPRFLSFSIFALIGLTLLTIAALFVDSIDARGLRITLTFVVFAGFVGLTALDTLRSSTRSWYPPAALLSNGIFLGASLLTVWLTTSSLGLGIYGIFLILIYALILRLSVLFGMLAMDAVDKEDRSVRVIDAPERQSSIAATWLAGIAAGLFVVYIAAKNILSGRVLNIDLGTFWDIYLKMSTAVLILAALALSISLLLRWFFGAEQRRFQRDAAASQRQQRAYEQGQQRVPVQAMPPGELLPWPLLADGAPYPQTADGQPDFERVRIESRSQSLEALGKVYEAEHEQSPVRPPANADLQGGSASQ